MADRTFDLKEILRNCIKLEGPEPQTKGEFLRLLILSARLQNQEILDLLLANSSLLAKSQLLESTEFHEGLGQVIPTKDMVSAILDTYVDKHQTRLAPVLAKLCGDGCLRPTGDDWDTIRLRVSNVDFREMMVKVIELRGNGLKGTMKFLCDVFRPSENFEVSECIRMILESAWILDFLPTKKKKARQFLHDTVLTVFPFAKKPVDDFVIDYLGLEPLPSVIPAKKEHLSSSSDSDVESRGSLDDFVVDEDEDDEGEEDDEESEVSGSSGSESSGSSESESSDSSESSADEKQIRKKTDKKRRKTVSSSSSNSD